MTNVRRLEWVFGMVLALVIILSPVGPLVGGLLAAALGVAGMTLLVAAPFAVIVGRPRQALRAASVPFMIVWAPLVWVFGLWAYIWLMIISWVAGWPLPRFPGRTYRYRRYYD